MLLFAAASDVPFHCNSVVMVWLLGAKRQVESSEMMRYHPYIDLNYLARLAGPLQLWPSGHGRMVARFTVSLASCLRTSERSYLITLVLLRQIQI